MSTDFWLLGGFVASWVACWCVGFIMRGWLEDERRRTIPDHPVLLGRRAWAPERHVHLRLVEGARLQRPYDYEAEGGA